MASPQVEEGFTRIANELLEALMRYKFPPKATVPQRICLFIIRKTYGYHKKMDRISLSQFQEGIDEKNRTNLSYWLKFLVQAKILLRNDLKNGQIEYGLNKNYEEWMSVVQAHALVQARKWSSASTDTKTSASTDTHKRKKETNTKEIAETSSAHTPGVIQIIDSFKEINPAFNSWYGNKTQRASAKWLIDNFGLEETLMKISFLPKLNTLPYAPITTTPYQLQTNIGKIRAFVQQIKNKSKAQSRGLEV